MRHFMNRSGGTGSWYTGRRVMDQASPGDEIHFVFADTKMEDEDLYRFLRETKGVDKKYAKRLGLKPRFHYLADGRDVWQVFDDVKYIGNSRIDPCSKVLKRDLIRKFLEDNFDPGDTICYIGIDWTEEHRYHKAVKFWEPYPVRAPLTSPPFATKDQIHQELADLGITPPRLYDMGFPHNNCGGFCVKGGHGAFKLLLEKMPERYARHEHKEQEFNERHRQNGKSQVTILRDRSRAIIMQRLGYTDEDVARDGNDWYVVATGEPLPKQLPLSLREFRLRVEGGLSPVDEFDLGGCACFTPDSDDSELTLTTDRETA